MAKVQVLVVEDELIVAEDICNKLERLGYARAVRRRVGVEAVEAAAELQPDLVLVDIGLPGEMDGVEAAGEIHDRLDIPVVFLTAHSDDATLARARAAAPFGYALNPVFDSRELGSTIEMALDRHEPGAALARERSALPGMYENAPNAYFLGRGQWPHQPVQPARLGAARLCTGRIGGAVGVRPLRRHAPGQEEAQAVFDQFLAGKVMRDEELQMQRADGRLLWGSLTVDPVRDASGQVVEGLAVVMDITDRKRIQRGIGPTHRPIGACSTR